MLLIAITHSNHVLLLVGYLGGASLFLTNTLNGNCINTGFPRTFTLSLISYYTQDLC